ncbi:hypothetical protein CS542_02065 [Pedobacter sp. IW39]|nr:hypothetical protein CS542_02065 [Pedobacter sp. IW39]
MAIAADYPVCCLLGYPILASGIGVCDQTIAKGIGLKMKPCPHWPVVLWLYQNPSSVYFCSTWPVRLCPGTNRTVDITALKR